MAIDRLASVKRAEGFVHAGQFESAIDEYARVFEEYPDDWGVANTLGDLHLRAGRKSRAVELFLQIGEAFHRQGFVPKAVALYKKALKARPGDEHALAHLALVAVHQELFADARLYLGQLLQQRRQRGDSVGVAECEARLAVLPDRRVPTQSGKASPAAPPPATLSPLHDEVSTASRTLPPTMPPRTVLSTAAASVPAASAPVAAKPAVAKPAAFATGAAPSATGATASGVTASVAATSKAAVPDAAVPDAALPEKLVLDAAVLGPAASDPAASGAAATPVAAGSQPIAPEAETTPAVTPTETPAVRSTETPAAATVAARRAAAATQDSPNETAVSAVESAAVPALASHVLERLSELPTPDHLDPAPILVPVTAPRAMEQVVDAEPAGARQVNRPAGGQEIADAPGIVEIVELGDLLDDAETDTVPAVLTPTLEAVTVPMAPLVASTTAANVATTVTSDFRSPETELLAPDSDTSLATSEVPRDADPFAAPVTPPESPSLSDAGFAALSEARGDAPVDLAADVLAPAAVLMPARALAEPDRSAAVAETVAAPDLSSALAHSIAELEAAAASPAFEFRAAAELGRLWIREGDLPQAARWLERAADVPAPVPEQGVSVRYDLGDTLERMNAAERALDVFRNIAMDAGDYRDVRARISRLEARETSGSVT